VLRDGGRRVLRDGPRRLLRGGRRQAAGRLRVARALADQVHAEQLTRHGTAMLSHVERVAAAVPAWARVLAWVHDVPEHSALDVDTVADRVALTADERDALALLTRPRSESLEAHVGRLLEAPLPARTLAIAVHRADLRDHLAAVPRHREPVYRAALARLDAAAD
jgi:hypothetical protein